MTLALYARRKGWPLDGVTVRLTHSRIHAQDCADCETKEGKLDQIEREIVLSGRLDDAQRARLAEMADKCPVHRTLTSEIKIRTRLGESAHTAAVEAVSAAKASRIANIMRFIITSPPFTFTSCDATGAGDVSRKSRPGGWRRLGHIARSVTTSTMRPAGARPLP